MRAGVGLGSNLGDRLGYLRTARAQILKLPGVERPFLFSSIYETAPVNCEAAAGRFLNAVIEIGYESSAADLLRELAAIEMSLGRKPSEQRNVSRKIDLDLLYLGDMKLKTFAVELPHPRLGSRRFVLEPLAEIRPDLQLPNQTKTVTALLVDLQNAEQVVQTPLQW